MRLALAILALALMAGCRASSLAKTASTTEVGYSTGSGTLDSDRWAAGGIDEDSWAVWVSIHPMAALEPPSPVYEVPAPPVEYLTFQSPVSSSTESDEDVPLERRPWWYRLEEVRGLLTWIGLGLGAGVLALASKLGWDKYSRAKR